MVVSPLELVLPMPYAVLPAREFDVRVRDVIAFIIHLVGPVPDLFFALEYAAVVARYR